MNLGPTAVVPGSDGLMGKRDKNLSHLHNIWECYYIYAVVGSRLFARYEAFDPL